MRITTFMGAAGAWLLLASSTACLAGPHAGGNIVFRLGGHGGAHSAGGFHGWSGPHAFPRLILQAGRGRGRRDGIYGARYGHTNTGLLARPGRLAGYGDVARGPVYADRLRWGRLGYGRRHLLGYAFAPQGAYGEHRSGQGIVGSNPYGYGYGGSVSAGPGYDAASAYRFSEPSLAATYAEPPLGPSPYGDTEELSFEDRESGYGPSERYGSGPRIISVRGEDGIQKQFCSCRRDSVQRPVVYRFGVGSYY